MFEHPVKFLKFKLHTNENVTKCANVTEFKAEYKPSLLTSTVVVDWKHFEWTDKGM